MQFSSDNFNTRLLAWGGYLTAMDAKGKKENRWILCINEPKQEMYITQHEQNHAVYPFKSILCVFTNLKYKNALAVFFSNGKQPLSFFCDSEQDKDALQQVIEAIPKGRARNAAIGVGVVEEEERTVQKKGKLKWSNRYMCVVKNRILVFRNKKAPFPLQMMSLLEPNMFIEISQQFEKSISVNCQEREFAFQMNNDTAVKDFVDVLERKRQKMIGEAKAYVKLKQVQKSQSTLAMKQKGVIERQKMQSKSMLKMSMRDMNAPTSQRSIMMPTGSTMKLDLSKDDNFRTVQNFANGKKRKMLKFDRPFKPGKHTASIFLWGYAKPPRLFPQHADQASPFRHEQLSQKRFIYVTAAKDGSHGFGYTDNDWTFVWGQCNNSGALGLGRDTKSTLPYLLKDLRKQHVIQVVCSSRHGLAITLSGKVYGWGSKTLTNLPADVSKPRVLPFLNNLGCTQVSCSSTHSAAYNHTTTDVFTWGLPGPWLGFEETNDKSFGRIEFHQSVKTDEKLAMAKIECGPQYTMILFSDGMVSACGINEHGRMGIGKDIPETPKPVFLENIPSIAEVNCGSFHCGMISRKGEVFTCGVGKDYRLGHGDEESVWEPKQVESLKDSKIVRIECVEDRTFVITRHGCVLMWGVEPVSEMVHTGPFVYEYMRPYRIYQVVGSKDFTIALGVHAKDPVPKPDIDGYDDPRMKKTQQVLMTEISSVMGTHNSIGGQGFGVTNVLGNYVQVEKTVDEEEPPPPPISGQLGMGYQNKNKPRQQSQTSQRSTFQQPPPMNNSYNQSQQSFGQHSFRQPPQQQIQSQQPLQQQNNYGYNPPKQKLNALSNFGGNNNNNSNVMDDSGSDEDDPDSDDEFYRKKQMKFGNGPPPPMNNQYNQPPPPFMTAQPLNNNNFGPPPPMNNGFGFPPPNNNFGPPPPMYGNNFGPPPINNFGPPPPMNNQWGPPPPKS